MLKEKLWIEEQKNLKSNLIERNCLPSEIDYIGGVDISFIKGDCINACAALVVLDAKSFNVVYSKCKMVKMEEPYIPGFLAFREVGHLVSLIEELKLTNSKFLPDVIFVDGNGVLHHRGFGLASHLGVLSNIPTIGIGKNLLMVDGITKDAVKKEFSSKCKKAGDFCALRGNSEKIWGASLKTTDNVTNPIYVSIGHKIDLKTAVELTTKVSFFRVPEPVRIADQISRNFLRVLNTKK
jgi:deoxyinosine 3'endonuclease (endonuclease V)